MSGGEGVLSGLKLLEGYRVPTYYSQGAKNRAKELSKIAENSIHFIREFFESDVQNTLLVLDEEDWNRRIKVPYGLIVGRDNILWYPTVEEDNPVYGNMVSYYESCPNTLKQELDSVLTGSDSPFLTACLVWWDSLMVHEYMHNFASGDPRILRAAVVRGVLRRLLHLRLPEEV